MIQTILEKALEHLFISFSALLIGASIALPLGFSLSRAKRKRFCTLIVRFISLIQTVPGLAMIAVMVVLLMNSQILPSTGYLPAILSLSVYAISPILTNSFTAVRAAPIAMIDVAKGLGMTKRQILVYVQIPYSLEMILAGIRIAGVWTIGMCTLTSLVGSGGLGDLILQGLRSMNVRYVLAGTIPSVFLAIFFELGMSTLEKWLKVDP